MYDAAGVAVRQRSRHAPHHMPRLGLCEHLLAHNAVEQVTASHNFHDLICTGSTMGCDGAWLHAKVVWTVSVSSSRCRTPRTMYSVLGVSNTSRTRTMFSWLTWQGTRSWCVDK
jgi:hypothetical protein